MTGAADEGRHHAALLLPYIGYFELAVAADVFILSDNIKYTKKGWIDRNGFLRNGQAAVDQRRLLNIQRGVPSCPVFSRFVRTS